MTDRAGDPKLHEPATDPARFPWREVSEAHYQWLEVDSMTKPMTLREDDPGHDGGGAREKRDGE